MNTVKTVATVKFWKEGKHGALRIGETRVSLDSVAFRFFEGDSPEEILESFPALRLSEVYAVVSYIMENRAEVEMYLEKQRKSADIIEANLRAKHGEKWDEFRSVLMTRAIEKGILPRS